MSHEDSFSASKALQPFGTPHGMETEPLTTPSEPKGNQGWDNEHNDLILYNNDRLLNELTNNIYVVTGKLGQGTFGQVVRCWSQLHRCLVAVKIIKNQAAFHQQAMVEVKILESLNRDYNADRHNFVRLLDYFRFRNHLCLVFEKLERNLFELIRFSGYQGFSLSLVKHFVKQVLQTLMVLHQERIIHGDLKPENVLMCDERSGIVKVIDFGSSCMEHETVYSYIQSRFYRSPEVVLAYPYDSAIDMWSLGCIAAELYLGLPLFPAASERDLLSRMVEILGPVPLSMLAASRRLQRYFKPNPTSAPGDVRFQDGYQLLTEREFEEQNREPAPTARKYFDYSNLRDIILRSKPQSGNADAHCFVDFLLGLLKIDPQKRWNAEQAAAHPFITGAAFQGPFHPPPTAPRAISRPVGIGTMHDARHHSASWHPNAAAHSIAHEAAMLAVSQLTNSVASNSSHLAAGVHGMGSFVGSGVLGMSPETNPIMMAAMRAAQQAFSNPSCPATFQATAQPAASPRDRRISGFHVAPPTQSTTDTSASQGQPSVARHSRPMADINEHGPHVEQSCHLQTSNSTSLEQNNNVSVSSNEGGQICFGSSVSRRPGFGTGGGVPRPFFTSGFSQWDNTSSAWQMPIPTELPGVQTSSSHSSEQQRSHGMSSNNASGVSFTDQAAFFEEALTPKAIDASGPTTFSHQSLPWSEGFSEFGQSILFGRSSEAENPRQADRIRLSRPHAGYPYGPRSPRSLFHEELLDEE